MTIFENQIVEAVSDELKKSDVIKMIKTDKDFEKRVKEIITDVIGELFKILWQHNGIYKNLLR